jgi:hypothetical protein
VTSGKRALVAEMSVTIVTMTIAVTLLSVATGVGIAATGRGAMAQPVVGPTLPRLATTRAAAAVAERAAVEAPGSVTTAKAPRRPVAVSRVATVVVTRMVTVTMPDAGVVRLLGAAAAIAATGELSQRLPVTLSGLDPRRPHRRGALDPGPATTTVTAVLATAGGLRAALRAQVVSAVAHTTAVTAIDTAATESAAGKPCLQYSRPARCRRARQMPALWCCSGARLRR